MKGNLVTLGVLIGGCTAGAVSRSTARLVSLHYAEPGGVEVQSDGAELEQALPEGVSLVASGLVETITLPGGSVASGDGHHHALASLPAPGPQATADLVTSASSITGAPGEKRRIEGNLGLRVRRLADAGPVELNASARVSREPDYSSASGALSATADVLDGNLSLSGALGYGRDHIEPTSVPTGQEKAWPAGHERINGAFALTQLLSPSATMSCGLAANLQWGQLANPYRRASVLASQYPEELPGRRLRATAFVRISWSPVQGLGLHLRLGAYGDDWGVRGWLPEAVVATELGYKGLLVLRYRHVQQGAASFASPLYEAPQRYMTGDVRLGRLREDAVGVRLSWDLLGSKFTERRVALFGSYDRSWFVFEDWGQRTSAGIIALGIDASY